MDFIKMIQVRIQTEEKVLIFDLGSKLSYLYFGKT